MSDTTDKPLLRYVGLEEHWLSSAVDPSMHKDMMPAHIIDRLYEVGPNRISEMDSVGLSMQILSHVPGYSTDLENYRAINDEMAAAVATAPSRFAALAHLPMVSPEKAADELRRCVAKLGFRGAHVDNHADGKYYEASEYDIFWKTAQELKAPVYLHPTFPTDETKSTYQGSFSSVARNAMSTYAVAWHQDTANHVLRLYAGGVFDRFPELKIILGHFGEGLPFFKQRLVGATMNWGVRRSFDQVYKENLWFTTSSLKEIAPLACLLQNTEVERIMFSMDYPFLQMDDAIHWVKLVRKSGLLSDEELELVACKNACQLLKLH